MPLCLAWLAPCAVTFWTAPTRFAMPQRAEQSETAAARRAWAAGVLARRFPDAQTRSHWQPSHGFILRAASRASPSKKSPSKPVARPLQKSHSEPDLAEHERWRRLRASAHGTAFTQLVANACARVQARAVAHQERVVARAVEATLLDAAEAEMAAVQAAVAACKREMRRERNAEVAHALKRAARAQVEAIDACLKNERAEEAKRQRAAVKEAVARTKSHAAKELAEALAKASDEAAEAQRSAVARAEAAAAARQAAAVERAVAACRAEAARERAAQAEAARRQIAAAEALAEQAELERARAATELHAKRTTALGDLMDLQTQAKASRVAAAEAVERLRASPAPGAPLSATSERGDGLSRRLFEQA